MKKALWHPAMRMRFGRSLWLCGLCAPLSGASGVRRPSQANTLAARSNACKHVPACAALRAPPCAVMCRRAAPFGMCT
eukprot:365443-Chlamydomonas_euryale.AAC.19